MVALGIDPVLPVSDAMRLARSLALKHGRTFYVHMVTVTSARVDEEPGTFMCERVTYDDACEHMGSMHGYPHEDRAAVAAAAA